MQRQALRVVRVVAVGLAGLLLAVLPGTEARAASWADSLFSERGQDFGPVARGAKVRHAFVVTNRLTEPVTILNIRASCGCTSGKANATRLAPGQATTIDAEMDTRNFTARKATTLYVSLMTASGQEAEVRLAVSSLILSDIVLNPGTIEFGAVAKGQSVQKTLTIERIGAPKWEVTRMVSACKAIDALVVETARTAVSVNYKLTVTLKPDARPGVLRDEIQILTNDPETPRIPVQVNGQIRGDLTAYPSVLALGKVASASGVQGRYMIRGTRPFRITAIEGNGDGFKLEAAEGEAKAMQALTVSYNPAEGTSRGDLVRNFRVTTDIPGEPPVELTATLHIDP